MNAPRLDSLVRSLGEAPSRRGLLAGLSATALALAATRLPIDVEAKKKRKKHKKKKHKKQSATPQPPATPQTPTTPVTKVDATCSGPPGGSLGFSDGDCRIGQTFTALASGPLASAELQIYKLAGSGGTYILRLSPVDGAGAPTNTVLASAWVPNLNVPDAISTVTFTFADPAAVVAGTQYALVLTRPGSNQLKWRGHVDSACSGSLFSSESQTAAFIASATALDLHFTTFVSS